MSDIEKMKELKKRYFELVEKYGEEETENHAFRKSLLELNKQHRLTAIQMFEAEILKIEKNNNSKNS